MHSTSFSQAYVLTRMEQNILCGANDPLVSLMIADNSTTRPLKGYHLLNSLL